MFTRRKSVMIEIRSEMLNIILFWFLATNTAYVRCQDYEDYQEAGAWSSPLCNSFLDDEACPMLHCINNISATESIPVNGYLNTCNRRSLQVSVPVLPSITSKTFSKVPNTDSFYILDLRENHIQQILPGAFNNFDNLKELILTNNEVTVLERGMFNSLGKLEILRLDGNQIAHLEQRAFFGCLSLEEIDLNNNNLSNISSDIFSEATELQHLDLSGNHLKTFALNILNNLYLNHFNHLNLSGNKLETFNFNGYSLVTLLDLSNNNISHILNWQRSNVKQLYLDNNHLKEMLEIRNSNVNISLKGNKIQVLNASSDFTYKPLEMLDVSFNMIVSIDRNFFSTLHSLQTLFLNHNQIEKIDIDLLNSLTQLSYLDISSNLLTNLQQGTFSNLHNLQLLNISNNKFVALHYDLSLVNLRELFFDNNRLSALDVPSLLQQSKHLQTISLNGNQWTCKDLMRIYMTLNNSHVDILKGDSYNTENVQGIACKEIQDESPTSSVFNRVEVDKVMNDLSAKFKQTFNSAFENSEFFKYFQTDYKRSSFFKYLDTYKFYVNQAKDNNQSESDSKLELKSLQEDEQQKNVLILILVVLIVLTCASFALVYFLKLGIEALVRTRNVQSDAETSQIELSENL